MDDQSSSVLGKIVEKIQDARYLFLLGIAVVVGGATAFSGNNVLAIATIGAAFSLVLALSLLDLLSARGARATGWVRMKFPEGSPTPSISAGKYEVKPAIADHSQQSRPRSGTVTPARDANTWVVQIPRDASPNDAIVYTLTDSAGRTWKTETYIPALYWPVLNVTEA